MTHPRLPTADLPHRIADAVARVRMDSKLEPRVGITLGSGLGRAADALEQAVTFPTDQIPHWPRSTVPGHAGRLVLGRWRGVPVAALAGRSHCYEGYAIDIVTFGVRVMHALGVRTMLFTNAVGAMNPELTPGDLMVATDHVNFIGKRGLFTPEELRERRLGRRVAQVYSPALRAALLDAGRRAGVLLRQGVLMGSLGPSYETAAEVRMAAHLGADVVCMSTVHEALLAAHLGCEVASLSTVTNRATGLSATRLTHDEVTEVADAAAARLRAVFEAWLEGA